MSTVPDVSTLFDPKAAWRLHPQVAVRPERFGALLYHFGTRRLSFLKSRELLDLVSVLQNHESATAAFDSLSIAAAHRGPLISAMRSLAETGMIQRRTTP